MNLITIKQFAKRHGVTHQAIRYQAKQGKLKLVTKFGVQLISDKLKYKPRNK